jgi:hypothetical protein
MEASVDQLKQVAEGPDGERAALNDQAPLSCMEEIEVLLAEYNSLRTELLQRNTTSFQTFGVGGTAFVGIVAYVFTRSILWGSVLTIILFALLWLVLRMFDFDSRNAAARISQLEAAINEKAGSKLLAWESDFGLQAPNRESVRLTVCERSMAGCHQRIVVGKRSAKKMMNCA